MKRAKVVGLLMAALVAAVGAFEWRYSDDMQQHIAGVNHDLTSLNLDEALSHGLIGQLGVIRERIDIGGEIIETHNHVHTLKDELLAYQIKKTVEESDTVGQATYAVLARWPHLVN